MTDEPQGRELQPRDPAEVETTDSAIAPAPDAEHRAVERFSAGPRAHTVGLTEERSAQIVRQSGNARNIVFLAILVLALFIPVYWFYETGIPALGQEGRLDAEASVQYVTDVSRGYELYLANCARCHGPDGGGGIGPPLNDQPKLYNALTDDLQPGTGHLNPIYIENVLTVGGRYVCGDPDSQMAVWLQPDGPLNYRQVEELNAWLTASSEIAFEHEVGGEGDHGEGGGESVLVRGWRDPTWEPEPDATPPPACWRAPDGLTAATPDDGGSDVDGSDIIPGTPDEPRIISLVATGSLTFTDVDGVTIDAIPVVEGETVVFEIENAAGFDHNFYIGEESTLMAPNATTNIGIPTWSEGVQTVEWTVESSAPLQFACTVPGHYGPMHGDIVITG